MKVQAWRALVLAGTALGLATVASADLIAAGKTAPAWSGKTLAGKTLSSAQLKNKVVLVNFFSYG